MENQCAEGLPDGRAFLEEKELTRPCFLRKPCYFQLPQRPLFLIKISLYIYNVNCYMY